MLNLDNIQAEADKTFGAPAKLQLRDGTVIQLRNILRLPQVEREKVTAQLTQINTLQDKPDDERTMEDVDALSDIAFEILRNVASDPDRLVKELNGDLAVALKVLQGWMEETQAGEADSSES